MEVGLSSLKHQTLSIPYYRHCIIADNGKVFYIVRQSLQTGRGDDEGRNSFKIEEEQYRKLYNVCLKMKKKTHRRVYLFSVFRVRS